MTRNEAEFLILGIVMRKGLGIGMEPEFVIGKIKSYVDERYEIDFSDEACAGEYVDTVELAEWFDAYLKEEA